MNSRLKSLAYRMLGSVADAEDVVQEAALRLHTANPKPDSEEAFLMRVVSNLSIDRLRRLKTEREHYSGPWLPEPILDDETLGAELAEGLGIGFLLLLEVLSPAERIVYVLNEGFDFNFSEIAELLEITAASARQRGHRARRKLLEHKQPAKTPAAEQQALLTSLVASMGSGDVQAVMSLLQEDAVAYTDGGGVVSAATIPVNGRERIAQVAMHLLSKVQGEGTVEMRFAAVNGGCALIMMLNGETHSCISISAEQGLVQNVYVTRNPNKLRNV